MIGFENFSVSSWFENGLTRHVAAPKAKALRQISKVVGAALITTALGSISPAAVANTLPVEINQTVVSSVKSASAPEVPTGYWPALTKAMKAWDAVEEPDIEYPD